MRQFTRDVDGVFEQGRHLICDPDPKRCGTVVPLPASTKAPVIPAANCRACAERFVWKHEECLNPIGPLGRVVFHGHPRPSTRTIAPNGIIKGFAASPSSAGAENVWTPYTLPSATRRMVSCFYVNATLPRSFNDGSLKKAYPPRRLSASVMTSPSWLVLMLKI
jgi:hypothetical protein